MSAARLAVGVLSTHPVQYHAPWYRLLAQLVDLKVFYCHQQSAADQARAGFGVAFEWDTPLLEGYHYRFLTNRAQHPDVSTFGGCDTPEIAALIRAQRFDAFLVHGWYVKSYWQAILACWQTGTPLLVRGDSQLGTARSALKRLLKTVLYRGFIPRFDAYLTVGRRAKAYLRHYGADERRMFFAPHAVDNRFFAERAHALAPQRAALRAAWGLPADAVVCLFAGKLADHKRPHDLVQAIARAARAEPRLWGLVAGDGPLRAELEQAVATAGLPVRFAGFLNQSEMPWAYCAADLLVVPGPETWGLVVNEAMASGLPALVADAVGCADDLVLPGVTGEQFPLAAVEQLAELMVVLTRDANRRVALGRQAARHIERYSLYASVAGTFEGLQAVGRKRNSNAHRSKQSYVQPQR